MPWPKGVPRTAEQRARISASSPHLSGSDHPGFKHGMRGSPTYNSWQAMLQRVKRKPEYAGRGIQVCAEWVFFENFYADMGERPDGLTLDRIDNDGHYEPGNCRWATASEQRRNQRPSHPRGKYRKRSST